MQIKKYIAKLQIADAIEHPDNRNTAIELRKDYLSVESDTVYIHDYSMPTGIGVPGNTVVMGVSGSTYWGAGGGAQGATGVLGPTGAYGGPPGETGLQGATGTSFLDDKFDFPAITPIEIMWNRDKEALFFGGTGYGGHWIQISAGSNVGATGFQGETGAQGLQGPSGPQGVTGSQGPTGAQGQGVTGLKGATGVGGAASDTTSLYLTSDYGFTGSGTEYISIPFANYIIPAGKIVTYDGVLYITVNTGGPVNLDVGLGCTGTNPDFVGTQYYSEDMGSSVVDDVYDTVWSTGKTFKGYSTKTGILRICGSFKSSGSGDTVYIFGYPYSSDMWTIKAGSWIRYTEEQ